jgi:hypothetical protein
MIETMFFIDLIIAIATLFTSLTNFVDRYWEAGFVFLILSALASFHAAAMRKGM